MKKDDGIHKPRGGRGELVLNQIKQKNSFEKLSFPRIVSQNFVKTNI